MQPNSALALIPFLVLIVLAIARPDAEENVDSVPPCLGCEVDQDSNKSLYKNMAEESILKYLTDNNFDKYHKIIKITKATQQVVAGYMYRIDFDASPTNCDLDSDEDTSTCEVMDTSKFLNCHTEIWERAWLDQKQIKVTCEDGHREKRQIAGGVTEQDPKNPMYADLATESLALYAKDKGLSGSHEIVEVTKATRQVVAGYLTHVYFNALIGSSTPVTCHSLVLEQAWLNVRNITVTCDLIEGNKEKEPNPGGEQEKDKNDPIYYQLANESFEKYKTDIGSTECHQVLTIERVTEQVVSGYITRINFYVKFTYSNDTLLCHSKIWQQPWLNRKEIDIDCVSKN